MDPYTPIPATSSTSSDNDTSADEIKANDRRAERARAFKQTLDRSNATAASAASVPSSAAMARAASLPARPPAPLPFAMPMTPAMLRLQAEGYPLPTTAADKGAGEAVPVPTGADVAASAGSTGRPETSKGQANTQPSTMTPPATSHQKVPPPRERDADLRQRRDPQAGKQSGTGGSAPDPRYLLNPVALPTTRQAEAQPAAPAARPMPSPELLQQLVEFATVQHTTDGTIEFQLGLVRDALGGAKIKLSAYGNRRVGLTIKNGGGGGNGGIGDEEIAGLIEALRLKDVEVVQVDRG